MKNQPTAAIETLGCKVSQYESQAIAEKLEANGFTMRHFSDVCDVYIINTCTVTAESDRKGRQMIRRAIHKNPRALVIVTGCLSQAQPEMVAAIEGVDYVFGSRDKLKTVDAAVQFVKDGVHPHKAVLHISPVENTGFEAMQITSSERTRAYLKIEDGCENRCTYCAIPGARGHVASKRTEAVLSEVKTLCEQGYREIVLTGIEVASWGKDLGEDNLCDLLELVDKVPGVERIRLGSLDPSFMKHENVLRLAALKHLMPQFHLSMQSGTDHVLQLMKRKYNISQARAIMADIREQIPNVMFTTDMMTGFAGETPEDFNETLNFVRQAGFLHIHVFPFSRRKNTPAWEMPCQVEVEERSRRAALLKALSEKITLDIFHAQIQAGKKYPVLFEQYHNGINSGHTPNFMEVFVPGEEIGHGVFENIRLCTVRDGKLYGEIDHEF